MTDLPTRAPAPSEPVISRGNKMFSILKVQARCSVIILYSRKIQQKTRLVC